MRKRTNEDVEFLSDLLAKTKEQLVVTQRIIKKIERDFSRNPHDEFAEENIREIYDSLQSLNYCFSITESEDRE